MDKEFLIQNLTYIISALSIIVTILIFITTNHITNKREFAKTLDEIYKKTFSLRNDIKNIAETTCKIDFHYEIDTIINTREIEIAVLDYLTEIDNLSIIVTKRKGCVYKKLFNKLVSPELYKRLLCLYPYIIFKQQSTKNYDLFSNYLDLILKIEKEKIKSNFYPFIYSGIRESDIEYDKEFFKDNLCLFSNDLSKSFKSYRANQNYNKSDYTNFYADKFIQINQKWKYSDYKLMFYNQNNVFELSSIIKEHAVCYNSKKTLIMLNDKVEMKKFLKRNKIKVPNYIVVNGFNLKKKNIINSIKSKQIIAQSTHGGGGIGTYLITKQTFASIHDKFNDSSLYIISEYIDNSISVNVHVFISQNSNIITPASVQLIEVIDNQLMYRGADFISFRDIDMDIQEKVRCEAVKICNCLRKEGYIGVAGIDFIIDKKGVIYCSEINPRFQASSVLISKYLDDRKIKSCRSSKKIKEDTSIYLINYNAFNNIVKSSLSFYDHIDYSCYFYYNDSKLPLSDVEIKLELMQKCPNVIDIGYDGFYNFNQSLINDNSYYFRVIYNNKIAQISPDHDLWINDNIKLVKAPNDDIKLKISLINQGVCLETNKEFKKAVFSGIDFQLKYNQLFVNCPINLLYNDLSPFIIKENNNSYHLYYLSKYISEIDIEKDIINAEFNKNIKDVVYLSTDRIRIKPINGCDYKGSGLGCSFCELKHSKRHYSLLEIKNALEYCKTLKFEHILIGGGTDLSNNAWKNIIEIVKMTKEVFPDKPISLMCIPVPNQYLKDLHAAGVNDVAYNIEIHNTETAKKYMPGKRNCNTDMYYEALKSAVTEFGEGFVRSAFVVGLEDTKSLIDGIRKLCNIRVIPCLSVYRMSNGSEISLNPTNDYLEFVYLESKKIAEKSGLFIGPLCEKCKNNMLSF